MIKKSLYILLVVVYFSLTSAMAKDYEVTASNVNGVMSTHYRHMDTWVELDGKTPTVFIKTKGDCVTVPEWVCRNQWHDHDFDCPGHDHSPDHHHHDHMNDPHGNHHHGQTHSHQVCGWEPKLICNEQTGRFPLPAEDVIFDGKKRFKFIRDGQYLTIGRNNRLWYFPFIREWQLNENAKLHVSNDYMSVTLVVRTPE